MRERIGATFLNAVALLLLLQERVAATKENSFPTKRFLSEEKFLSYEPFTTVTDVAAIDMDLRDLIGELAKGTAQGKENALRIYSQGAYSKSYARLDLDSEEGLPVNVTKGTEIVGETSSGVQALGKFLKDAHQGDTSINFQYHVSTVQAKWTECHYKNLEGCLAARGSIEIGDLGSFSYTYDPKHDHKNARSLQTLSTKAQEKMFLCKYDCPYPTYLRMYEFYGIADYGNRWITAAFNQTYTNFIKGNAQFSVDVGEKEEGANEAIVKGALVLNLWMYVNKELEHASALCIAQQDCTGEDCSNEARLHTWDKAVAFYTGSYSKSTGYGGYLLYTLAQKRCRNFGTCLTTTKDSGMAHVNSEIFKLFLKGQADLMMEPPNCASVLANVKRITQLMTVPLIQGVLRYAYHQDNPPVHVLNMAKTEAEGATFAAAILPLLDSCSESDATLLYDNMRVGNGGTANFQYVKEALERNYDCMGLSCVDIGGLIDVVKDNAYMPGAEPCGITKPEETTAVSATTSFSSSPSSASPKSTGDDGPNVGLAVGLTMFFILVFMIAVAVFSKKKVNSNQEKYRGSYPSMPVLEAEMT